MGNSYLTPVAPEMLSAPRSCLDLSGNTKSPTVNIIPAFQEL